MDLSELQCQVHALARDKGWWDDPSPNVPEKLALIHSEVSEALEEYRREPRDIACHRTGEKGKPEGFPSELADTVIRVLDLCGFLGIDLEWHLAQKHAFNATRPWRHGGKSC